MEEEELKSVSDIILIGWRRKYHILVPTVILFIATIYIVSILPPIYRSHSTVLVESPQIAQDIVRSTDANLAGERIHLIVKRIMSNNQLLEIADKFGLFDREGATQHRSEQLKEMRKRIVVKIRGADGTSAPSNKSSTLAFNLSFEDQSARKAQQVVNELVTLFLNENIRSRTERAEDTTEFLAKESSRLGEQIENIEKKIADYKQEHEGSTPETLTVSMQRVGTLRAEYLRSETELASLEGQRNLLMVELKALQTQPVQSGAIDPERLALRKELKQLENEFITLSARYGSEHPDVKAAIRHIEAFRTQYGNLSEKAELIQQRKQAESEYQEATAKYSAEHPDIKRLERKLKGINLMIEQFDDNQAGKQLQVALSQNPKVLQAEAKLQSIDNSITRLKRARGKVQNQIQTLETRISRVPEVERGLDALQRDYENTKTKYQEIKSQLLQAELSRSLEEDEKGERFTLIEPPFLADVPVKPKRFQLLVFGLGLSLLCGIGAATLAESLDKSIRGTRALASATRMMPLVSIPYIRTSQDSKIRIRNIAVFIAAVVAVIAVLLTIIHYNIEPLDVVWTKILHKVNTP